MELWIGGVMDCRSIGLWECWKFEARIMLISFEWTKSAMPLKQNGIDQQK